MIARTYNPVRKPGASDRVEAFDCGQPALNLYLVHAKDEEAKHWYRQWEFEPSATDPLHLYLLMKDLKALVSESG